MPRVEAAGPAWFAFSELDPHPREVESPDEAMPWEVLEARAPGHPTRRWRAGTEPGLVPEKGPRLTGRVTNLAGQPLRGARVALRPRLLAQVAQEVATTDSDGSFLLEDLAPGVYRLEAVAPGFARSTVTVMLRTAAAGQIHLPLRRGWQATGVVRDPDGTPLEAVPISLVSVGEDFPHHATTDARGQFQIDGLPPERTYQVIARPSHLWPLLGQVTPSTPHVALAAGKGRRISVVTPVRARVWLESSDRPVPYTAVSGPDEPILIDNAPPRLDVRVEAPGVPTRTLSGTTKAALEVELDPGPQITLSIVDDEGRPVVGAEIRYSGRKGPPDAITDAEGIVRFAPSDPIDVERAGYARLEAVTPTSSPEGGTSLVLPRRGWIELRVIAQDEPVSSFEVQYTAALRHDHRDLGPAPVDTVQVSTSDGTALLDDLPRGTALLTVRTPEHRPWTSKAVRTDTGLTLLAELEAGVTVVGRVVDLSGAPVSEAAVYPIAVVDLDPHASRHPAGHTDVDGRFRLAGLDAPPNAVSALHPRFAPGERPVEDLSEPLTIRLPEGGRVRVRVPDSVASVRLTRDDRPELRQARPFEGEVLFEHVPAGPHRITVQSASSLRFQSVEVREGEEAEVRFDDTVVVTGRVLRRGRPQPTLSLRFEEADGPNRVATTTDRDGRFEVGLVPGTHHAVLQLPGATRSRRTIEVPASQEPFHRDLVIGDASVRGRVLAQADRRPVSEALVQLVDSEDESVGSVQTDGAGEFELAGLPDGTYSLVVRGDRGRGHFRREAIRVTDGVGPPEIEVILPDGGSITLWIVEAGGHPAAEAVVSLATEQGWPLPQNPSHVSDGMGRVELAGLSTGTYQIVVRKQGRAPHLEPEVLIRAGSDATHSIALGAGATLLVEGDPSHETVALLPRTGTPLEKLFGLAYPGGLTGRIPPGSPLTFEHLAPGPYDAVYDGPGGQVRRTVDLLEGVTTRIAP